MGLEAAVILLVVEKDRMFSLKMSNKTIFCVSTANCDLFKNNFCNSFMNHLPHFQEQSLNYEMSLGSIHKEKNI